MTRWTMVVLVCLALALLGCGPTSSAVPTATTAASQPAAVATRAPITAAGTSLPTASSAPAQAPAPTVAPPAPSAAATSGPTPVAGPPGPTTAPSAGATTVPAGFSGDLARHTVDVLAGDIGSRPAGSAARDRATEFLRSSFAALGLETRVQEFRFSGYLDGGASLRLVGARGDAFAPKTVAYSPAGEVEAELFDGGLGSARELAGAQGKLALIKRGQLRFADKVRNAADAGAVGVVMFNDGPGNIYASLFQEGPLPTAMLSGEEGEALKVLVDAGPQRAHLAVAGQVQELVGRNVVARKTGGSGKTVVVGGHYDSVPTGPGANDNGSGTAVTLETARVMAGRDYPHSIEFIAFDGEELGLLGSQYYVQQLSPEQRRSVVGMIDLDMLSVGDTLEFAGSDAIVQQALHLAEGHGWRADQLLGGRNGASDHASFLQAGIDAMFIYRSDDPRYHSPEDLPKYVEPANLEAAGTIALGLLDFLAGR